MKIMLKNGSVVDVDKNPIECKEFVELVISDRWVEIESNSKILQINTQHIIYIEYDKN